jgi:hypothetical protein
LMYHWKPAPIEPLGRCEVYGLALQLPFVCFEVGSLSCGLVSSTPE